MNEKIKMALLGLIAVALVVIAYSLISGDSGTIADPTKPRNTIAGGAADNTSTSERPTSTPATNVANPMTAESAAPAGPSTTVAFDKMVHDFGTITQDSENAQTFTFTNTGTEPLVIENAKGSCGCTVPEYPKNPVLPGETGEIKVVYKPGKQKNQQSKTVTVTANTEPKNTMLTIKANVLEGQS